MIANEIVTQLKTITPITDIFSTNIFAGSKFKMYSGPFLIVSPLSGNTYREIAEIGPITNGYQNQFIIVGEMDTTEATMFSRLETITDELGVGCGTLQDFGGVRVRTLSRTTVSPVIYNQERQTLTADFTFIV